MLSDALQFLVRTLFDLMACAFFMRFWMQWARVPFQNPLAQFIVKVTNFAVLPFRRVLPGWFGVDWASIALLYLTALASTLAVLALSGFPFGVAAESVWPGIALMALAAVLRLAIYVVMGFILLQAVISWVNPFSPFAPVFYALSRPALAPFQRWIPAIGGVDLSPLAALIVLQLLLIAPVLGLERVAMGMVR